MESNNQSKPTTFNYVSARHLPAEGLTMRDDHNSKQLTTLTSSEENVESYHQIASASYRHMRQGTMIESAAMLDNRVISYYFHQHFEVDIFPHGHRDIFPNDEDYSDICERFDLRNKGDKGVALWKLIDGRWISQCSSTIRTGKHSEKCEM
jgi:hypothetical protein